MLTGHYVNGEIQTTPERVLIITDRQLAALKTITKLGVYQMGCIEGRIVPEGIVEKESEG